METDILRFATYLGKSLICFTYQYEINFQLTACVNAETRVRYFTYFFFLLFGS